MVKLDPRVKKNVIINTAKPIFGFEKNKFFLFKENFPGINALIDIISYMLGTDPLEYKNVIQALIRNYYENESTNEDTLLVFNQLQIHPFALDKTRQIINDIKVPISTYDDQQIQPTNKRNR